MVIPTWGVLGPETLTSERRTRTLGLSATVRQFNDRAVPGLGGAWFGKQLFLATLGVAVAERLRGAGRRARNIEVANAVEALACWQALNCNGWNSDPRLRGAAKLAGRSDLSFAAVRRPDFYVTTPMRQATVQPLRALGLVEGSGERFNAFSCTAQGEAFVDEACIDFRPHKRSVVDHLVRWAAGDHDDVTSSGELRRALSPLDPLPRGARELLLERIVQGAGDAARRRQALVWVEQLRHEPGRRISWEVKPEPLDDAHWRDLRAGALFFATRGAALALLDRVEAHVAGRSDQRLPLDEPLPGAVIDDIEPLRNRGRAFLDNDHDPTAGAAASAFCRECTDPDGARVLERLLAREGRVLRQRGRDVVPGAAFRGSQPDQPESAPGREETGSEVAVSGDLELPEYISYRVRNLFLLNLDLRGELDGWLTEPTPEGGVS